MKPESLSHAFLIIFFSLLFTSSLYSQNQIVFFNENPVSSSFYDASWGYFNSPSSLQLVNNNKFPVETKHAHEGKHSLRLQWNSQSGGDWGIAVASIGWTGYDFTKFDSIWYWINAPQAISQIDLPDLAVEDLSNQKSNRIWLGDYFQGVDADTNSWQRVSIPINAFNSGADFSRIKTIFHFQRKTDGVTHIAWLDNIFVVKASGTTGDGPQNPQNFIITGHDQRVDLKWQPNNEKDLLGYYIYRKGINNSSFTRLTNAPHQFHIFSDFIGQNNQQFEYYVTAVNQWLKESLPSDTLLAATKAMTDEELLTSVQEATFRYFYDFGHPVSGLARERNSAGNTCASGGTGFGLMTIVVGTERRFVSRDSAASRILKIIRFLQDKAQRYHGAWSHWINGATGETIPFGEYDDGGDLVETAYLVQGLLTVRQYFNQDNSIENEIRQRATQLWEEVEWDWYRRYHDNKYLYWHWSPKYLWKMNFAIHGFNECMITYLLAIASPTHPVPANLFHSGWAGLYTYMNGRSYYDYKLWVGEPYGGPLFFTHYSFLGFDPRNKADRYCNYFDNNRHISLIHRAYCMENPKKFPGYGELCWGLTASDNPWGYNAHSPTNDNGTITPTAAISAMPYTPDASIPTMRNFYNTYGKKLWGEFGFKDAFNLKENWFAQSYIAIDQGTIVPMIENYRTGLCWNLFMSNPEIQPMLDAIGFKTTDIVDSQNLLPQQVNLSQNHPNPFNSQTTIQFSTSEPSPVTLEIYNLLGERVMMILNQQNFNRGKHSIQIDLQTLPSGVYFYRIKSEKFQDMKKMILMR